MTARVLENLKLGSVCMRLQNANQLKLKVWYVFYLFICLFISILTYQNMTVSWVSIFLYWQKKKKKSRRPVNNPHRNFNIYITPIAIPFMIAYFNLVLLDVFAFSEKHTTSPNKTLIWDNFGEKNKQTNLNFYTWLLWYGLGLGKGTMKRSHKHLWTILRQVMDQYELNTWNTPRLGLLQTAEGLTSTISGIDHLYCTQTTMVVCLLLGSKMLC